MKTMLIQILMMVGNSDHGGNTHADGNANNGNDNAGSNPGNDGQSGTDNDAGGDSNADTQSNQGAPEKYADFKLPEDRQITDEFLAEAKANGWTQEQAQLELDRTIELENSTIKDFTAQQQTQRKALVQSWVDEVRADPELGGDKHDTTMAVAKKALDTFGSPELNQLLEKTGLGSNILVIRCFQAIGQKISEDNRFVGGQSPGNHQTGDAGVLARMYPGGK